jgi:hypothetical protein
MVPALGYTVKGSMKQIGKAGKYLYPVTQLSLKFRGKFMAGVKKHLATQNLLSEYLDHVRKAWNKRWVVYCEPSLGKPEHVVGYLGQYTHRVAITNHRIVDIGDHEVLFSLKDYSDHGKQKTASLSGEEFLRRFCMHILPAGFVKIRHYGIYSSRFRSTILKDKDKMIIKPVETNIERINRLIGIDISRCPSCKKGLLILVDVIPRSRSPTLIGLNSFCLQG